MDKEHLGLTTREHQALMEQYRKGAHERVRLRAHILFLLADGYSWAILGGVLFGRTRTSARGKRRVEENGIQAARGTPPSTSRLGRWWGEVVAAGGGRAAHVTLGCCAVGGVVR